MWIDVESIQGCGPKIGEIFHQWIATQTSSELLALSRDKQLQTRQLFYGIWGVGESTALEFYEKGAVSIHYILNLFV